MIYALFFALLVCSMFFSSSETALFSIGKLARARLRRSTARLDKIIASLLAHPRDLLVTVLLGNELTNIAISIVGATITSQLLSDYSITAQALLSAAMVVPLLLVVGEITPKTVAANRSEPTARIVAIPLLAFSRVTAPIRWTLRRLSDVVVRRFGGVPESAEQTLDEQEIRTLVDVGAREGVFEDQERQLILNVLDFDDLIVRDVMKPWSEVFSLNERDHVDEAIAKVRERGYSRIPVWRGQPRRVMGVVHAKDLLPMHWGLQQPTSLRRLARRPIYTLAQRSVGDLLELFRQERTHIAIVVDEFGRAVGLCTMEDLLEELFGPIDDGAGSAK